MGSEYMTCGNDGWTPALPRCVEMTCDAPRINNAVIVSRRYTVFTERYRYGAFIQLRCNKGYRMEGSDRLKCEENGWNPPPPQCSVITCLEPDHITNGQFIPLKALYKYGETIIYNCVEGFKLYGSPTISCSDDGTFETSLPECRAIGF
ncbi:C4b-binding protein alpha chain-like [Silurus meridionalis]|nr:C4b-binding protein alpha chain-like [Silurus meridionalis]